MSTITLSNEFHGTEATVRPIAIIDGRYKGYHMITRQTVNKLRRKLCGSETCVCSGQLGNRGGEYVAVINEDFDRNLIIDLAISGDLDAPQTTNYAYPNYR